MIVFDLTCERGHRFEGWFRSSTDYEAQVDDGLIACPDCSSSAIGKAPMAPAVPVKGNAALPAAPQPADPPAEDRDGEDKGTKKPDKPKLPAKVAEAIGKLAELQAKALKKSEWVGPSFADRSRAMHYGEEDTRAIHGQASVEDAQELAEEGIEVMPLLFPLAAPEEVN